MGSPEELYILARTGSLGSLCERGDALHARMSIRLEADLTPEAIIFAVDDDSRHTLGVVESRENSRTPSRSSSAASDVNPIIELARAFRKILYL